MSEITLSWAENKDLDRLVALLHVMHGEVGRFPISMKKVTLKAATLLRKGRILMASSEGQLLGSIGLEADEPWYSDASLIGDSWIFVRPDVPHRLTVFRAMVAEVKKYAQAVGLPLVLSLNTAKDTRRKGDLFARYGEEIMRAFEYVPVGGEYRVQ